MMKEATILAKTKGLHTKITGKAIPYSEEGFQYLEAVVNFDISDGYRPVTRGGYSLAKIPSDAKDLFHYLGVTYGVFQGQLCKFTSFATPVPLAPAAGSSKMQYVGVNEKVYYSNGISNGVIVHGWNTVWAPTGYAGPDTTVTYTAPPAADYMSLFKGRIYLAKKEVLWFTEALYYDGVNLATDFIQFDSDIVMVVASETVLLIATGSQVYLLSGDSPDDFSLSKALPLAVVSGTAVVTENPILLGETVKGQIILFTATDGIYAVKQDGSIFDITEDRLDLPIALTGNAYMDNGFYTVLIDE